MGGDTFTFFITLANDRQTQGRFWSIHDVLLPKERIVRISIITFELNPLRFAVSRQKWNGKNEYEVMQALFRLSIASVISNQYIATKLCIPIEQILINIFPLSQQWFHVNMRKKCWKYITLRAASEKTPPQSSLPITTLATLAEWRRNVWVVACAGARI